MDLGVRLLSSLVVVVMFGSCGSDGKGVASGPDPNSLEGDYLASDVIEDGEPRTLVDDTQISIRLEGGQLSVHAGCNHIGGSYRIDDGVLRVDALSMTEMGCDEHRSAQDAFLADFVSAAPTVEVVADGFVLRTDAGAITFLERGVVEPDVDLEETSWVVDTFVDGAGPDGTASSRAGPMGRFTFGADGAVTGSDGCNDFSGLVYEVDGGTITFDPGSEIVSTDADCGPLDTDPFWAVFSADTTEWSIEGDRLTLTSGTQGLRAVAAGA